MPTDLRERRLRTIGVTREQWPAIRAAGMDRYVTARVPRHLPSLPGLLIMGGFLAAGFNTGSGGVTARWHQVRTIGFRLVHVFTAVFVGLLIAIGRHARTAGSSDMGFP